MVRILLVLLGSAVVALAQEQPTPSPSPSASPESAPEPSATSTPDATPAAEATPTPDATPAAEATPASEATPAVEATPASVTDAPPAPTVEPAASPAADVIPIEGQPTIATPDLNAPPAGGIPLETQDLSPELPTGNVPDAAFTDPNAIVPDAAPLPPAMPQAMESAEEKARELTIRYREVRVEADKDPEILAMYEKSNKAKTDEDKRAALRTYYRMLFAKMVKMDKSLEDRCRTMEDAYIRRLAQDRLEPTIPLNPPPTPEPLSR